MSNVNGVYVLVIKISKPISINVGALGTVNFEKGIYAYVGSAKKGLNKRIKRHLRRDKRKFWHIDYLLSDNGVKVLKVFKAKTENLGECEAANIIGKRGIPVGGFGSSDCRCISHLFKIKDYQFLREFM
ncbi:MAG: GIY-YIG nuclease family protein, partial [Candidatus Bathycorpusculaceae bacterium]